MIEINIKTTQTHTRNPENTLAVARASPPGVLFLYWIGGPGRTGTVRWEGPREQPLNRDCQKKQKNIKERKRVSSLNLNLNLLLLTTGPKPSQLTKGFHHLKTRLHGPLAMEE